MNSLPKSRCGCFIHPGHSPRITLFVNYSGKKKSLIIGIKMRHQTGHSFRLLPEKWIAVTLNFAQKASILFIRFNPNFLTLLGLMAGAAAGFFFALGWPIWAALAIVLCSAFDILDGKVAARTHKTSLYGAMFDSTLDRYSEFFIYLGLAFHFRKSWVLWIPILAFLGSTMVSYTRARAEGLGFECRVGFMQRAERMSLLLTGAVLGTIFRVFNPSMIAVLALIAIVSNVTAIQRTLHVKRQEALRKAEKEN